MRALVIAPQPFFSPRGTPLSVYYRTRVMAEYGVQMDLLTYGEGEDVDIPGLRIIRIPRFSMLGNVKIGPSFLKLFLDVVLLMWAIGLLVRHRYDFVHAHEEAVFFCRFLKPAFRFKLVYDMHSCLPQQLSNFQFTKSRLLINLFRKLEETCLRSSEAVITICPDLAAYATGILHDGEKKHLLIENSIFDPVRLVSKVSPNVGSSASIRGAEAGPLELPPDRRYVVFAGTLEPYQGIDLLIEAFKIVADRDSRAILLIVGGTPQQVRYYAGMVDRYELASRCVFTGRVPKHIAEHYCRQASVQVSPRVSGTNTPLKIYEQLASGVPLVATNIYSHTQVLSDEVAYLVEPDSAEVARGILSALQNDAETRRITENARRLYETKYARPVYEGKILRLLDILRVAEANG